MKDIEKVSTTCLHNCNKLSKFALSFVIVGWFISACLHLPFCWQFKAVPCHNDTASSTCWNIEGTLVSQTVAWQVYGYVYQLVAKVLPMSLIFSLNICIMVKARSIMIKRQQLKNKAKAGHNRIISSSSRQASSKLDGG